MFLTNLKDIHALDIETKTDFKTIRLVGVLIGDKTGYCKWPLSGYTDFFTDPYDNILLNHVKGGYIVTWNGSRFDIPLLEKHDAWFTKSQLHDTGTLHIDGMILAKMLYPDEHSHSLKHFAKKFFPSKPEYWKDDISDPEWYDTASFSELSDYLKQDLIVTKLVVQKLLQKANSLGGLSRWRTPLQLEQEVAAIVSKQVEKKVNFDIEAASKLYHKIGERMDELANLVEAHLPETPIAKAKIDHPPKKQFKMDGTLTVGMEHWVIRNKCATSMDLEGKYTLLTSDGRWLDLPITEPIETHRPMTLADQSQLKHWLMTKKGWTPSWWNTKKNDKGKHVVTTPRLVHKETKEPDPNLTKIDFEYATEISEWLMLRSRRGVLLSTARNNGWIFKAIEGKEDDLYLLPSDADSCGTPTARFRHRVIANVPRPSSPLGQDMRDLFCARPDKVWVGWDADSLEARMEGHYTYSFDEGAYAKELIEGDVHTKNMEKLDLPSRDIAKTLKYGLTYGATAPKVAEILGSTLSYGEEVFKEFWITNPALNQLRAAIRTEWVENGKQYITGLDGRLIYTRSEHSLMNAKFQSGGAIAMKWAMVIMMDSVKYSAAVAGAYGLIRYHDEEIWECDPDQADTILKLGCASVGAAGRTLKLRLPLTASGKVGQTWADIH